MVVYATDQVMSEHARRSAPEDVPLLRRFMDMDMDERWVARSPQAMLETFHWFHGEGFGLIVDDLQRLSRNQAMIAEGFTLLPHLVQPPLANPAHAVWLLPTRPISVELRSVSAAHCGRSLQNRATRIEL